MSTEEPFVSFRVKLIGRRTIIAWIGVTILVAGVVGALVGLPHIITYGFYSFGVTLAVAPYFDEQPVFNRGRLSSMIHILSGIIALAAVYIGGLPPSILPEGYSIASVLIAVIALGVFFYL